MDDASHVPAGVFFEIVNLVVFELHMKNLSYSARLAKGEEAEKLSLRLAAMQASASRLRKEGEELPGGLRRLRVHYFQSRGIGRRFAYGPSFQKLKSLDRGVALRGVSSVVDIDQEAAHYVVLLENAKKIVDAGNLRRVACTPCMKVVRSPRLQSTVNASLTCVPWGAGRPFAAPLVATTRNSQRVQRDTGRGGLLRHRTRSASDRLAEPTVVQNMCPVAIMGGR